MFCQGQLAVHGLAILLGRNEAGISNRGKNFLHDAVLLPDTLHHTQESRGTRRPELCRFPFKWKGKEHHSCTTIGDPEHKPWCPVSLDRQGNAEQQRWGHCNPRLCSAQIELDMLDSAKMMSHLDSASNKSNSRGSATKSKSRGSATSAESTISNLTGSESSSLDSRSRTCQTVSHIETDLEIQSLTCLNFSRWVNPRHQTLCLTNPAFSRSPTRGRSTGNALLMAYHQMKTRYVILFAIKSSIRY